MCASKYDLIGILPGYLTTTLAGARAGVSSETIRRWVRDGLLHGIRVNRGTLLVSAADLDRLIAERAHR